MTIKQQLYKKYRLEGYSKYTAARMAGYRHNTAIAAKQNIENHINMDFWLEKAGLTDKALANHATEGMNATKPISAIVYGKDADSKTTDFVDVPDWSARHKYFDSILKLRGKILPVNIDNSININHYSWSEILIENEKARKGIDTKSNNRISAESLAVQ